MQTSLPYELTKNKLIWRDREYSLPQFFPDATYGVVRGIPSNQLMEIGLRGLVVNTYHLWQTLGLEALKKVGGIKKLMNWQDLITSDSGGFQLYSLIHRHPQLGKVTDEGIVTYSDQKKQHKHVFSPSDSIKMQLAIGSDLVICLDDFTPDDADEARTEESVRRTLQWAAKCKETFNEELAAAGQNNELRPLLLAPIQGAKHPKWRKFCADGLLEIGFDAYGLGGWPFDKQGNFDYEFCELNARLTPDNILRFALGVGSPENIVQLKKMGYHFFDCVLPTRDARHKRLYVWKLDPQVITHEQINKGNVPQDWYEHFYCGREVLTTDLQPISEFCSCSTCKNYSRAYLNHLFKVKDNLAFSLASVHNLTFYRELTSLLTRLEV